MKKLFAVLLTVCLAFSITACANSVDPVVDDAVEDYVPSIDHYEVEAIIVQYENSGQYFLSDTEIKEFAQLYNQHESYRASEEELGEEEYVVSLFLFVSGNSIRKDNFIYIADMGKL